MILRLCYPHNGISHTGKMTSNQGPGVHLNIEMPSYQYRDYHVKDKTYL